MEKNDFIKIVDELKINEDDIKNVNRYYLQLKKEIDTEVDILKNKILKCDPLSLLQFAQWNSLMNKVNINSESQKLEFELLAIDRFTEYVQSVYVSSTLNVNDEVEKEFETILDDFNNLYKKIINFLKYFALKKIEENKEDEQLVTSILESQLMFGVRGKRYQFIELDYFSGLLMPHNKIFQDLFNISAAEILYGIEKLQYALSQGKFDALKELQDSHKKFQESPNREVTIESESDEGLDLLSKIFGFSLNNVVEVTNWPEAFVRELSYECGQEDSFFSDKEYSGWPIIDLPIQKRPFIKIDNEYYCFDYYSFIDNFYRSIQKMVTRISSSYNWGDIQQDASESMVSEIFEKILPKCTVYKNNYYPINKSIKHMAENDLMILYYDILIIVEVKAGSFVWTAPFTDFDKHIKSYKTLIEKADSQCKRTYDYLKSNGGVLYNENKDEKVNIDMTSIRDIYTISVTMDNIGTFATKAEKLSFLNLKCNTISLSVDDLMIYQKYFTNPLLFLHFLKQRRLAIKSKELVLNDELDHLGMYIKHNCYPIYFSAEEVTSKYFYFGYRKDLDIYFNQLIFKHLKPKKPKISLPKYFIQIIKWLSLSDLNNKIQISNYLLDFSTEAKDNLNELIEHSLQNQLTTNRCSDISSCGNDVIRYTCFVWLEGSRDYSINHKIDFVLSKMLYNTESDRTLINMKFSKEKQLIDIEFKNLTVKDVPKEKKQMLYEMGKSIALFNKSKYQIK